MVKTKVIQGRTRTDADLAIVPANFKYSHFQIRLILLFDIAIKYGGRARCEYAPNRVYPISRGESKCETPPHRLVDYGLPFIT